MNKYLGAVRSISYHEESRDSWGLEKPVRQSEGPVIMEVAIYDLEVLQDIRAGGIIQIEKKKD